MVTVCAIDPGTKCGWAVRQADGTFHSGVWNLKGSRFEGGGMRFLRMEDYFTALYETANFERVYFEEVRRHMGVDAGHVYGGIIAVVTKCCEKWSIPYTGIPVSHVKQAATGKGNAKKDAMIAAAQERWPEVKFEDDNEADARWILVAATKAV